MISLNRKSSIESLQEEFGRERAEVLASAGNSVFAAIEALQTKSRVIAAGLDKLREFGRKGGRGQGDEDAKGRRLKLERELDINISEYNKLHERARLRYYYLLVTREAMGLRNHQWVEGVYRVPDRIKPLNHEASPSFTDRAI